jgi:hypothetical protein
MQLVQGPYRHTCRSTCILSSSDRPAKRAKACMWISTTIISPSTSWPVLSPSCTSGDAVGDYLTDGTHLGTLITSVGKRMQGDGGCRVSSCTAVFARSNLLSS